MFIDSYQPTVGDSLAEARSIDRGAIQESIDLLTAARDRGVRSMEAVQAVHYTARIWMKLMEDLASDDNQLPEELRASLISIGIWILKGVERIRRGEDENFTGLIEVSTIIRDGMR